jgi:hypothetical protein
VSGSALVGETLTCNAGTWSGTPTFSRRWLRNGANIAGQFGETYVLTATDLGKAIQCQVTATAGAATESALSAPRYVNVSAPEVPGVRAYSVYQVYETSPDGSLRLVSVLPDGTPALTHSAAGTKQNAEGESREDSLLNAVSADGERVFWTASEEANPVPLKGSRDQVGPLYLRLNATHPQSAIVGGECTEPAKACTIEISAGPRARFVAANPQGTRVIYSRVVGTEEQPFGKELLEAEIEEVGGKLVAVSHQIADGVRGVMGISEDTTRVYLASTEVLGGANSQGEEAVAGKPNLYLYEAGVGFTFVGTLAPFDLFTALGVGGSVPAAISTTPKLRVSRISRSGLQAAFTTSAPLTGYDNTDQVREEPALEAYVFDASAGGAGELYCASCSPSGARPRGRAFGDGNGGFLAFAAEIPVWISQTHPGNALSENGRRLFFNAFDSLVPGDTNGKADVYEWEAAGEGDCTEASAAFSGANGGCISLISSGESATDSGFLDATPSGSDVFFTTQSSLVEQDYGLNDVYDARVNAGLPGPLLPPPSCEGEACQGTPAAPNDPTPASSAFQGAGNVKEGAPSKPRCGKGKARKKDRCVKKHKAAKNRAKGSRR